MAPEVLGLKLGSPLYLATTEWFPTARAIGAVNAALSEFTLTLLATVVVALSTKSTVPEASKLPVFGLSLTSARSRKLPGNGALVAATIPELVETYELATVRLGWGLTVTDTGA